MEDRSIRKDSWPFYPFIEDLITTPSMQDSLQTSEEIRKQIRESLGLPPKSEAMTVLVHEGHCCEFPLWSFSKMRSTLKGLHIDYDDGSFLTVKAPEQTPPIHLFRQWSLKPTGFLWVKLPLGRPHFSIYDVALYYIV